MAKRIASPEDLKAVREKALAGIHLRTGEKETRLTIHMGTCGIAAGARDVLGALIDELNHADGHSASVHQAGCAGLCDQEPMLSLVDKAGTMFRYGRVDKRKAREIVRQHVLRGVPVNEYLVKA